MLHTRIEISQGKFMRACVRVSVYLFGGPSKAIFRCSLVIFKIIEIRVINYLVEEFRQFSKYVSIIKQNAAKQIYQNSNISSQESEKAL